MGILDDTAIFTAVIQQGGFSRAAKYLGLSNGLISRRIALLETKLGVTLIKRTTRQLELTPEGELFWQHAKRIQQEMDSAVSLIQASAQKPKGSIRIGAPVYFGRRYLSDIIVKFMRDFSDIHIHLILSNEQMDPIKDQLDLVIRGAGYLDASTLKDSSMQMKKLVQEKIGLYASPDYLASFSQLASHSTLNQHKLIYFNIDKQLDKNASWSCEKDNQQYTVPVKPSFTCNDIETCLTICAKGEGIGRFTELNVKDAVQHKRLIPILTQYDWGHYYLFAVYPQQKALPRRTRLLLDFIDAHARHLIGKM